MPAMTSLKAYEVTMTNASVVKQFDDDNLDISVASSKSPNAYTRQLLF